MIPALLLELRRGRMLVLWVSVVSALYAGFITAFYPTILDNAAEFERMLALYPKELMAAFGISGSLGDPGTFVNTYIYQFLWPLVAAIAGIALATRVASDAETGFLDIPLSTRLPRLRYLGSLIGAQVVSLGVIAALTVAAIVGVDLLIEPDFDAGRLVLAGAHSWTMALAIAGVTTLLAVILLDRGRAGGLAAGILIVMYLLNVVAQLSPDLADLARVSAFHYFDLRPVIDTGTYPAADSALFLAVAVTGWLLALVVFRRRDLAA
jgi:ABC-2 type transport system permease protein